MIGGTLSTVYIDTVYIRIHDNDDYRILLLGKLNASVDCSCCSC